MPHARNRRHLLALAGGASGMPSAEFAARVASETATWVQVDKRL